MSLTSPDDWWFIAGKIIYKLKPYAASFGISFNEEEAVLAMDNEDHDKLHEMLEDLHAALPDNMSIRRQPFFDLCDLCSEHWVFDLDPGEDE
jgi:hypothetical protein